MASLDSAARGFRPRLAWTGERFERDLRLLVERGRIVAIERGPADAPFPEPVSDCVDLTRHALLPGFVNAHSHAFQRGLRGRGERFPTGAGSFWTWREAMYQLVNSVDREHLFALCRCAFEEMLAAGITTVGEFHYLHHLGRRATGPGVEDAWAGDDVVMAAARATGIRFVLLQTAYQTGGFGQPLEDGQARFDTRDLSTYWRQLDRLAGRLDGRREHLGVAAHSLRAVPPHDVTALMAGARERGLPFHLHLEEQRQEIAACRQAHGRTPMALLLDSLSAAAAGDLQGAVAVHCTHSDPGELTEFLAAGGGVNLCPTTEANLGDGVPDASPWVRAPHSLSLGTDSNARLSMLEELRWAELGQRLARERRGVLRFADAPKTRPPGEMTDGAVARGLLEAATRGGARALGLAGETGASGTATIGRLEVGARADFVAIDLEHPSLRHTAEADLAEALVFGCGNAVIDGTWVDGRRVGPSRHR